MQADVRASVVDSLDDAVVVIDGSRVVVAWNAAMERLTSCARTDALACPIEEVLASLPPIGASLVVGFFMSLFQATTQIQESTLSVVPKLCAAVLALVLAGPWIAGQLTRFTHQLLMAISEVAL